MFFEMTLQEAIEARHSVRAYKELPLAEDVVKVLKGLRPKKDFYWTLYGLSGFGSDSG